MSLLLLSQLSCSLCLGQEPAEAIPEIGPVGSIELVRDGFQFTEGPADDRNGTLYFSDIPAETIFQLQGDKVTTLTTKSGHSNGLMVDGAGRLLACQMDGQLVRRDLASGKVEVLASEYKGKRFNAPNDLVLDQHGGVYFTDPLFRAPKPLPQATQGIYYVSAKGEITRLDSDLPAPNGIALSPDEKTLYVIPSESAEMLAYQVTDAGKISGRRVFCRLRQNDDTGNRGGDGMTVDTQGNLYITSELGVQVFSPAGEFLGNIAFPQHPANVTFGGPERRTLYVTARTGLYRCKMKAVGHVYPGPKN